MASLPFVRTITIKEPGLNVNQFAFVVVGSSQGFNELLFISLDERAANAFCKARIEMLIAACDHTSLTPFPEVNANTISVECDKCGLAGELEVDFREVEWKS